MKTTFDLPDYPASAIQAGERLRADVTIDYDGEMDNFSDAPIDFAPGILHVHSRVDRIHVVYEFHRFRHGYWRLQLASWFAASLGRSLPLRRANFSVDVNTLVVHPPWPLDFVISIHGLESDVIDRIVEAFS